MLPANTVWESVDAIRETGDEYLIEMTELVEKDALQKDQESRKRSDEDRPAPRWKAAMRQSVAWLYREARTKNKCQDDSCDCDAASRRSPGSVCEPKPVKEEKLPGNGNAAPDGEEEDLKELRLS